MVGAVGRFVGAMVRDDFTEDPRVPAGRHDSRAGAGIWALDPLSEGAGPAAAHRRSRTALHRSVPPPVRG